MNNTDETSFILDSILSSGVTTDAERDEAEGLAKDLLTMENLLRNLHDQMVTDTGREMAKATAQQVTQLTMIRLALTEAVRVWDENRKKFLTALDKTE